MNLTFSLANFLTAIGIVGGAILLAYKIGQKIGEYTTALNATLAKITEVQAAHSQRIGAVEREVGELMNSGRAA